MTLFEIFLDMMQKGVHKDKTEMKWDALGFTVRRPLPVAYMIQTGKGKATEAKMC